MSRNRVYYSCRIEYMNAGGEKAIVEWVEAGKEVSRLSVARQMGYYEAIGRVILQATTARRNGYDNEETDEFDVEAALY